MAVSAVIGAATAVNAYGQYKAGKQQKQAMAQQEDQFNQTADLERQRMQGEMEIARANIAAQNAALGQQWAALNAQKDAAAKAQALAEKNARDADIANNKANRKAPNVGAMLTANDKAGAAGGASTLLTGPGGAGVGTLGKSTALGQ